MELYFNEDRVRLVTRAWSWKEIGYTMGKLADTINEQLQKVYAQMDKAGEKCERIKIVECELIHVYNDELMCFHDSWQYTFCRSKLIIKEEWNPIVIMIYKAINQIDDHLK